MLTIIRRCRRGARTEAGAVAIFVALTLTILLIITGMVLDFGLARLDRQTNKSAADDAVSAGMLGLDIGDGRVHPYRGVCQALEYLQANVPELATLNWADCTDATKLAKICDDSDSTTWAKFSGSAGGYSVRIEMPYGLPDNDFSEDALPTLSADVGQPCEHLAVIVTQTRAPGFGSLATSGDLRTTVRSVGRVQTGPGGDAPAMLLLKRTGCPVLSTGSNSGGSHIYVLGAESSDDKTQPGTIHSDSDGENCTGGSNQNIFLGKAADGIVAFAAPLANNPTQPDPAQPGLITTVAATKGKSGGVLRDSNSQVCGSTMNVPPGPPLVIPANPCGASPTEVTGRGIVTRSLVDERYLTAVDTAVSIAQAAIFAQVTSASEANTRGYKVVTCNGSGEVTAFPATPLTPADKLYVDCATVKSFPGPVLAGEVVFSGVVNPSSTISLPNAKKVYVFGSSSNGLNLGSGTFSMHTAGNLTGTPSRCSDSVTSTTNKAMLFVKNGQIKESNGGLLQLCYTTVVMMGGESDACLPPYAGGSIPPVNAIPGPTQTPCNGATGTGQLSQTGGDLDWTAPNSIDVTTDADGVPLPAAVAAWGDVNGPEDLAFWSESSGSNSNPTYNMNGQGTLHTVGVYMAPNADPFIIGGGAGQTLSNAQYITTSIALNGTNTSITMRVDPNSAVTLPKLESQLVR